MKKKDLCCYICIRNFTKKDKNNHSFFDIEVFIQIRIFFKFKGVELY